MGRPTLQQELEWKECIDRWSVSGQSVAEWCRENEVGYHKFLHWKKRFSEKAIPPRRQSFLEIPEETSSDTGIMVEYQGVSIQLSKSFDHSVLQSLITCLRKL